MVTGERKVEAVKKQGRGGGAEGECGVGGRTGEGGEVTGRGGGVEGG